MLYAFAFSRWSVKLAAGSKLKKTDESRSFCVYVVYAVLRTSLEALHWTLESFFYLLTCIWTADGWRRGSVVMTSVFGCGTFPDIYLIYG